MKNVCLLITILTLFIKTSVAFEPPRPPDTITGGSYTPHQSAIMQAPVVMGISQPVLIVPNSEPLCFDKHMVVKSLVNGQLAEQCLWLNTNDGLIGHLKTARSGGVSLCDIKPNEVDFSFFIYGLKGNTYHYFNRKPKLTIEHYVSTANSQNYLYQATTPPGSNTAVLHKKTETRMYCDDKFKGKAYKFDGGEQTWYLFGEDYPETLVWEGFFGNFGVGYLKTDKGLYIILEMEFDDNTFKVISLEDVHVCFDPRPFQIMEDQFYTSRREALNKERQKMVIKQAKLSSGDCIPERTALYNWEMQELERQEQNLENSMVGNAWQNAQTQQAISGMFDPTHMLQANILETKISLCKAMISVSRNPSSVSVNDRMICLSGFLAVEEATLSQMNALDIQYADEPGKALAEKSHLYLQLMTHACN